MNKAFKSCAQEERIQCPGSRLALSATTCVILGKSTQTLTLFSHL